MRIIGMGGWLYVDRTECRGCEGDGTIGMEWKGVRRWE